MIDFQDIRQVHLEISSLCNASCPWCPRTFWGYPYNAGYPEVNLTLVQAKKIIDINFLQQLTSIDINGNFGDLVMNSESPDIVEYFREHNSNLAINISTNGSARTAEFWQRLASCDANISFCLDGLSDTHHLYRQNTNWHAIIKNAQIFINSGGRAIWKFIRLNHNEHQIDECRALSKELGFSEFCVVDDGRNTAPVFNKHGTLTHVLGNYTGERDFKILFHKKTTDQIMLEDIIPGRTTKHNISCATQTRKSIYIAANGDISPCCYTGFHPKTYGHGQYHEAANAQLIPLIHKNNALQYPLEECIEWFSNITACWNKSSYESGRLVICDDVCGS